MARIEYKFSKDEIDLIGLGKVSHTFNENTDYIRLNVFQSEEDGGELLYSFASNRPLLKDNDGKYYFGEYHLDQGKYYSGRKADDEADPPQQELTVATNNQFKVFFDESNPNVEPGTQFYLKPNEILDKAGLTEGNYVIKIDSFKNLFDCGLPGCSTELTPFGQQTRFQVKQIGSSRKELRLIITDYVNRDINFESIRPQFTNMLGNPDSNKEIVNELGDLVPNPNYNPYRFEWAVSVLNQGISIPILNYMFDDTGKGETTLLLKLAEELPTEIGEFDYVIVGKQLTSTVVEEIYFVSTVEQLVNPSSMPYDAGMLEEIGNDDTVDIFENYNEVTGGLQDLTVLEDIISGSDVNLNVDFGSFDNHVFFGSAKRKIDNFILKVKKIEDYYTEISKSLKTNTLHISASSFETGPNILHPDSSSFTNWNKAGKKQRGYKDESEISSSYFTFNDSMNTNLIETGSVDSFGNMYLTLRGDGTDGNFRRMAKSTGTNWDNGKYFNYNTKSQSMLITFDMKLNDAPTTFNPLEKVQNFWNSVDIVKNPTLSSDWQTYQYRSRGGTRQNGGGVTIFAVGGTSGSATSSISIDDISIKPIHSIRNPKSVTDLRKYYFKQIEKEITSFTPFEKYLYFGTHPTSSIPNLGKNHTNHRVVKDQNKHQLFNSMDGFNGVHKVSMSQHIGDEKASTLSLFDETYKVQDSPFFNSTSSFYLSFLSKGDTGLTSGDGKITYLNYQTSSIPRLPQDIVKLETLEEPAIQEFGWRRYIYRASSSYWRPVEGVKSVGFPGGVDDFSYNSSDIERLYDSDVTGSFPIQTAGQYQHLSSVVTQSGELFSGSMLPSGELFHIKYTGVQGIISSSYLADVKITKGDPRKVNPFQHVYSTGSDEFISWYDRIIEKADLYDTNNIHSLINNLPAFIQDDCVEDHSVMIKFVDMLGEYYDLLRVYIDNYKSFVKPGFSGTEIAPDNVLSVLAADKDWEFILPFTGSLMEHLGGTFDKAERTKDTVNNTFRKIYNSLIGIYKSKGSLNSVRTLLNAYGMPPEVLKLREHGASLDAHDLSVIANDTNAILDGVSLATGSISFEKKTDTMYSYMFNHDDKRTLFVDWHMNGAGTTDMSGSSDAECIQFVVKPDRGTVPQTILRLSGSQNESYWDLRIMPTGSSQERGFVEFRLNHHTESYVGHAGTPSSSLKTPELGIKTNEFWNIMLYKDKETYDNNTTPSGSEIWNHMTTSYHLVVGRNTGDKIRDLHAMSMSVSNPLANRAWACTGSQAVGGRSEIGNLVVGETLTGSLAELRLWKSPISYSRFKQHILDKKSAVGNQLLSTQNDLQWHYRLNENWQHNETNPRIVDANPNRGKDYTKTLDSTIFDTGSILYDMTEITRTVFGLRTDGNEMVNDNNIIIQPDEKAVGNIHHKKPSRLSSFDTLEEKRTASTIVEIVRSPQDVINDFIVNAVGDFDINDYFASAQELENAEYSELLKLQDDFLQHFDISLDVNKYIRAQAAVFNKSLIESIKRLLPARATLDTVGIELKDTYLNREKLPQPKISQEHSRPEDEIKIDIEETGEFKDFPTEIVYSQNLETEYGIYETELDSWRAIPSQESGTLAAENVNIDTNPIDYRVEGMTINDLGTEPYIANVEADMDADCHKQFRDPFFDHGTGSGAVKFPSPWDTTRPGEEDSNHYESRYVFPMIGDVEVISQSNDITAGGEGQTDYNSSKHFKNNQTTNIYAPSLGQRPIGTTARFYTENQNSASGIEAFKQGKRLDDNYIYPANHIYIVGSSKDAFDNLFYKGTQAGAETDLNQKHLESDIHTDLSSASFYTVNVTGENVLKVNRGTKD